MPYNTLFSKKLISRIFFLFALLELFSLPNTLLLAQDKTQSIEKDHPIHSKYVFGIHGYANLGFLQQTQGSVAPAAGYEIGGFIQFPGRHFHFQLELNYFNKSANSKFLYSYTYPTINNVFSTFKETSNGFSLPLLFKYNHFLSRNMDIYAGAQLTNWYNTIPGTLNGAGTKTIDWLGGLNIYLSPQFGLDFRFSQFATYLKRNTPVYSNLNLPEPSFYVPPVITGPKTDSFSSLSLGLLYKF